MVNRVLRCLNDKRLNNVEEEEEESEEEREAIDTNFCIDGIGKGSYNSYYSYHCIETISPGRR